MKARHLEHQLVRFVLGDVEPAHVRGLVGVDEPELLVHAATDGRPEMASCAAGPVIAKVPGKTASTVNVATPWFEAVRTLPAPSLALTHTKYAPAARDDATVHDVDARLLTLAT